MKNDRIMQESIMVWNAIDTLARKNNMTCSALARRSGLDATTFNKSKRFDAYGQPHLPSMKSVLKVLIYTNLSWHDFADLTMPDTDK